MLVTADLLRDLSQLQYTLGDIRNGQLKLLDVNDKVRARIEP